MPRRNLTCECDAFYCYPLSEKDREDTVAIKGFVPMHPAGAGVIEYLQDEAYRDERKGTMRTYLVRAKYTDEFVGFFSLRSGLVSTKEMGAGTVASFDTLPGVEVAYLAVDQRFREKYPVSAGCGIVLFNDLILPIIREAAKIVGIARVYIFALDEKRLMENYRKYGFRSLQADQERALHRRLKPVGAQGCRFMYMSL